MTKTYTPKDLSIVYQGGEFAFVPHTRRADEFLSQTFRTIGDRDLTAADLVAISASAQLAGFVVHDTRPTPKGWDRVEAGLEG